nr:signal peptidase I [uncultured Carboxylicivirga sp.]
MKVKKFLKRILYSFMVLLVGFGIRLFVFGVYMVDSGSMEETYYKGDVVLVNKLAYGARLSMKLGDLPLLSIFNHQFGINDLNIRVFPLGSINHGDVIVFNQPNNLEKYVKRCTGLPGDSFEIKHNVIYIDGKVQKDPEAVRYSYKISVNNGILPFDTLKKYGVNTYGHLWREGNEEHYTLSKSEVEMLKECSSVHKIEIDDYPKGAPGPKLFPSGRYKYTRENFGPVIIPSKGMTILLDSANIYFYSDIIVRYEHNNLRIENSEIYINDKKKKYYTFQQDYFFAMGDNRYQSYDSRYWGFVPEINVMGKVSCVLF